jgi:hypothetical protein
VIPIYEKLDRFLATTEWMDVYPLVQVTALTRYQSDHTPLLLDTGDRIQRNSQFKMELYWLAREDIHSVVDPIWTLPAGDRSAIEEWNWRMGNSRRVLKGWNKNVESEYKKEKKVV